MERLKEKTGNSLIIWGEKWNQTLANQNRNSQVIRFLCRSCGWMRMERRIWERRRRRRRRREDWSPHAGAAKKPNCIQKEKNRVEFFYLILKWPQNFILFIVYVQSHTFLVTKVGIAYLNTVTQLINRWFYICHQLSCPYEYTHL